MSTERRANLNRDRVLDAAISLADTQGVEALSMRSLALTLGVVPMALYKHVANKEDLLDAMIETVVASIDDAPATGDWRPDVRRRMLAAHACLGRHGWARVVLESRPAMTPAMLAYLNGLAGLFLDGGLSADLTHHAMHALGNRMWGFSQELFAATPSSDPSFAAQKEALPARFPHLAAIAMAAAHPGGAQTTSPGCDEQAEFEFALDLLLDGVEVLHARQWTSAARGSRQEGMPRRPARLGRA